MRSPFKEKRLRGPGETLERQLEEYFVGPIFFLIAVPILMVAMALVEWWRWYSLSPPSPWVMSIVAALAVVVCGLKLRPALKRAKNISLGLEGEKSVGQFLETLRADGALVVHDIPGEGFNVDHVLIHATGVYVIETKALSKPDRGRCEIVFDGERILKNGLEPDRNPISQVSAAGRWVRDLLKNSTGREFPVRPVVLVPGWFTQRTGKGKASHIWVLNLPGFKAFLDYESEKLAVEDMHLCQDRLSVHVRNARGGR